MCALPSARLTGSWPRNLQLLGEKSPKCELSHLGLCLESSQAILDLILFGVTSGFTPQLSQLNLNSFRVFAAKVK